MKVIKRESQIYPVYSKESCNIHKDDNPVLSKLDVFNIPEVSIEVKIAEYGNYYFDVFGKNLYLSTNFKQLYQYNNDYGLGYFMKYVWEIKITKKTFWKKKKIKFKNIREKKKRKIFKY